MLRNTNNVLHGMALSTLVGVKPHAGMDAEQSIGKLPYGVCISIGTVAYVLSRQLGFA
jgi:prepilin peptidase CpaA